jgi:hypothetical protein
VLLRLNLNSKSIFGMVASGQSPKIQNSPLIRGSWEQCSNERKLLTYMALQHECTAAWRVRGCLTLR